MPGPRHSSMATFLLINALTGVGSALIISTSSLFLTAAIHLSPLAMGFFLTARAAVGAAADLGIGALSDRIGSRRVLIMACLTMSAFGSLGYAVLRDYVWLLCIGVVLLGLGGASFPLLFAYSHDFAVARGLKISLVNSLTRSVGSAVWALAPPLGFLAITEWGFTALYAIAAAGYFLSALLFALPIPAVATAAATVEHRPARRETGVPRQVFLLLVAVFLLLTANGMYMVDIALFVTSSLHYSSTYVGLLLGLSAAAEVPLMIYLGAHSERIGRARLIGLAGLGSVVFFLALEQTRSLPALFLLQALNAAWTSVVLSVPVSLLQEMLPNRAGTASSLYSSTLRIALLGAGALSGYTAQQLGYVRFFWVPALLGASAAALAPLLRQDAAAASAAVPAEP